MRILVAGGAGFVGSNLCESLLGEGHEVICVDNLFTSERLNIAHLESNPKFTFLEKDITEPLDIEGDIDQIYSLACPASPPHYQYNPLKTMKTAFNGLYNLLELATAKKARILQASTSEVYGEPLEHPQQEGYRGNVSPIGPRACYDEGKRIGETLMFDFHRVFKTDIRVIRIFNTYGPHMHPYDGRVISNFIQQALSGKDITIYGDGSQTRSFQFVSDLLNGMKKMMNNDSGFQGPVNIGNPVEFSIKQLAEMVTEQCKTESKAVYLERPVDDPTQRKPDISLAKEKLDWEPTVQLREGLEKTIAYFRSIDIAQYRPPTKNYENPDYLTNK